MLGVDDVLKGGRYCIGLIGLIGYIRLIGHIRLIGQIRPISYLSSG